MIGKAKEYVTLKIKEHPELEEEIMEDFFLFLAEVEDGSSPYHEYELMVNSIEDLITDTL